MTINPMVSVRLMTYKHEIFVAQAIESILAQKTNFDYEIVIGDDLSPDKTLEIVNSYKQKYPSIIRIIERKKNIGNVRNFVDIVQNCIGKYIALLDGDDYWTSPHKLQKQIDFLEDHPECSGCFHNVITVYDDAPEKNHKFHEKPLTNKFFTLKEIAAAHFIPTCSTVFRAGLFGDFPHWFTEMPIADWPLHVLNAEYGSYGYLDEVMACYRIHGGGIWSAKNRITVLDKTLIACRQIDRFLAGRYSKELGKFIRDFEIEASEILADQQEYSKALLRVAKAFYASPTSVSRLYKQIILILAAKLSQPRAMI